MAADPEPAQTELEEVIVTGSLIRSPNQSSSSPIVSAGMEDLERAGDVSLIANLNQLPQFNAQSGVFSGGQGTGGRVTINLRGLGSNRNLILLDGRRLPLSDINGNVDTNAIPESSVSTIDVITGGASAVYGSDAMSGVVNFLSEPYFDGVQGGHPVWEFQPRATWRRCRHPSRWVHPLRTNVDGYCCRSAIPIAKACMVPREASSSSSRRRRSSARVHSSPQRPIFPIATAVNDLFASYGVATPVSNTLNLGFNDDGTLFTQTGARNYLGPTSDGFAVLAGNVRMPVGPQFLLVSPTDRNSLLTKFDFEISDALKLYGQLMYVDSKVYTESGGSLTQFGTLTTIPVTNPFIPDDLATLLASRPTATAPFTWNGRYVGLPYKGWDEQYTTTQYVFGGMGELPMGDWSYDLYVSYDTTDHNQTMHHAVLKNRVQTLLNAPDGGNSICAGGFNPFGLVNSSNISQQCQNYMTTNATSTEYLEQTIVQGTIQGALFELPAGEVRMALLGRLA